ncbi:MAG: electron transport complex subunit E [Clostridia bacterium]|jgi:electron transport complex protein RnfE|nr:electron transport complex subunit E [Clostridia bacterium]
MNKIIKQFKDAAILNNPTFIQVLGMCPTLATTTSAENALGMGLAATAVLILSNVIISLLRKIIPNQVRIASYIVIISGAVTAIELLMKAYLVDLYDSLGIFIPLIVVNCIILARAEAFASKNNVFSSFIDGVATGLGFTGALFIVGCIRELLGAGSIFGIAILPEALHATIFIMAPGAFLTLGAVIALVQKIKKTLENKKKAEINTENDGEEVII